jgi:hypothetical protein
VSKKWLPVVFIGLAIAVAIALLSPLASSHPDGLERVAEDEGFIEEAKDNPYDIIPDYTFPGVDNEDTATVISGIIGVAIVAAMGFGLAFLAKSMSRKTSNGGRSSASSPGNG